MTVGRREIEEAVERITGRVRTTPVMDLDVAGTVVAAKLELLQHTGSFKPRGAFNRMLAEELPAAGVVAASGGNHGLAVAHVARTLGVHAAIFIPEVTPVVKRDRMVEMGAEVVAVGAIYDDALEASRVRVAETGALEVHAYDHRLTVAGQGTMGREILRQVPDADTILVAVGGGGLIAGVAAWVQGDAAVVSVEPEKIPAMAAALDAGHPVEVEVSGIAADSLGAKAIGQVPFDVARRHVDHAVLVSDDAIREAQRFLWRSTRLVVEPGGATAMAAILSGAYRPEPGERVVVVVCGSNTDPGSVSG